MTDDPFALPEDFDKTVIKPSPGRKRQAATTAQPAPASAAAISEEPILTSGKTPLLQAANPLLAMAVELRHTASSPDLDSLRDTLTRMVHEFEENAVMNKVRPEFVTAARYCLCTFLDETISGTPWGSQGMWANRSLLVAFHNEAWGGEKFFALLRRVGENPAANIDLLELMYLCLAFGFEGRYRVQERGRSELDALRENLANTVRMQRGEFERGLSPAWQPGIGTHQRFVRWVPLWVAASVAALLLLAIFLAFSYLLNRESDPVFAALHGIPGTPPPRKTVAEPPLRIAVLLQPEIMQDLLQVAEYGDRSVVTIHGDGLFESGSADIKPRYLPVLQRIASAVDAVYGVVVVTGHTDDRPIFSARYPSNWHLSKARADSVVEVLGAALRDRSRIRAEGRADTEPLVRNDSPANRALNRRVEISVLGGVAPSDSVGK